MIIFWSTRARHFKDTESSPCDGRHFKAIEEKLLVDDELVDGGHSKPDDETLHRGSHASQVETCETQNFLLRC